MAALGLPEPSDYAPPVNGPQGGAFVPELPPDGQPADPSPAEAPEVTPFPADPPAIKGELITENVFQKGA